MNAPASFPVSFSPDRRVNVSRVARALLLLVLVFLYSVFLWLALMTRLPVLAEIFASTPLMGGNAVNPAALWPTIAWFAILPVAAFAWVWRRGWAQWRPLVLAGLAALPVVVYLGRDDDPMRVTVEWGPQPADTAENRASFETTLWFREGYGPPEAQAWEGGDFDLGVPLRVREVDVWTEAILAKRDEIEAAWAEFEIGRRWFAAMDATGGPADLTAPTLDATIMRWPPFSRYMKLVTARAGLLALDGRGDEAVREVLPLLRVTRGLRPGCRTLVRYMIGLTGEREALRALEFVLARTDVSEKLRQEVAAVLAAGPAGPAEMARMMWIDYTPTLHALPDPGWRNRVVVGLIYNAQRSRNELATLTARLADAAATRDLARAEAITTEFAEYRPTFKNAAGGWMVRNIVPDMDRVVTVFWEIEDQRAALLETLRTGAVGAVGQQAGGDA